MEERSWQNTLPLSWPTVYPAWVSLFFSPLPWVQPVKSALMPMTGEML